jgi:hypothetical protein
MHIKMQNNMRMIYFRSVKKNPMYSAKKKGWRPPKCMLSTALHAQGLVTIFFNPSTTLKKKTLGRNVKFSYNTFSK